MSSPLLILAGIPAKSLAKRAAYAFDYAGWECSRIDTPSKDVDLQYCWEEVTQAIASHEKQGEEGVHILAFHKSEREHNEYRTEVNPYHRIVFLGMSVLGQFGRDMGAFREALDAQVRFEELWREKIRPTMPSAPLILPETRFRAPGRFKQIWAEATHFVDGEAKLEILGKTIDRFRQDLHAEKTSKKYGKQVGYRDDRNLFWSYTGARHGNLLEDRICESWKFNYKMDPGLHYDVQPFEGQSPMYFAHEGREHRFDGHVNIYPHGTIRS